MKYRKKPIVVEATQWFPGVNIPRVFVAQTTANPQPNDTTAFAVPEQHYVVTIHGDAAYLSPGDWVINELDDRHAYPCKPDIFEQTYEPVTKGYAPFSHKSGVAEGGT